jgi:hypothetical protein
MSYDLVGIRQELEEAIARIPGTPATPLDEYYRYEETAAAINDVRFMEFGTDHDLLELYLLKLCEVKAMELGVVLDFQG